MGAAFKVPHGKPGEEAKLDFVLHHIRKHTGHRPPWSITVLDVGCGGGDFSIPLAKLGYRVVGIDNYLPKLIKGRSGAKGKYPLFVAGDVMKLPLRSSFDVVLSIEILEHLWDPESFLRTISSQIAPDGLFVATIPNGRSLLERYRQVVDQLKMWPWGSKLVRVKRALLNTPISSLSFHPGDQHRQHFSFGDFVTLLRRNRLRIIEWRKAGALYAALRPLGVIHPDRSWFGWFDRIDAKFSPFLPRWMAGGWYFACVQNRDEDG